MGASGRIENAVFVVLFLFFSLGLDFSNSRISLSQVEAQSSESVFTTYMSKEEKNELRKKTLEMFYHAYNSYMDVAYPADELMPLSCKGRYRGTEPLRGDVDDTLGNFTLTLIDTLDTLAVLGDFDEFDKAVRNVIRDARFDTDVVVSVFETNIRILGGLLGGHVAASYFKRKKMCVLWYQDELLTMAKEVGDRLLPAFNTSTGIPYPRINMKHGMTTKLSGSRDTCTSCAGTMILEFAALSRLTGISVYEEKARKAMDYLWAQRHRSNNLMGMVLNIHNGDWVRRESGVGAGIDSYYEYVLKGYVLLGDDTYLARFNKHYDAVKTYVSQGPLLIDVHMHKPTSIARNFMDSLLAFWPGLQVLAGDIGPAVETHEMLYQVVQRHNFLPEAFTTDFRVHWGQHPLRPEFLESTYFLYKATSDPHYLEVGKKVLENLETHARVPCGFAAIKDVKKGTHEDQMDSFVLAETFKYLYLLFSEKKDVVIDVDDFVFTTEAHLLPLTLSVGNYSWQNPKKAPHDFYKFDMMSVAEMTKAVDDDVQMMLDQEEDSTYDEDWGVCRNYHVTVPEGHGYPHRLRTNLKNLVDQRLPPSKSECPKLKATDFNASNKEHIELLQTMGIRIASMADGKIQLLHTASEAVSQAHADSGLEFMQQMIELSKMQKQEHHHEPMFVRLLSPPYNGEMLYRAGPAQFGYNLSKNPPVEGEIVVAASIKACGELLNPKEIKGKIAVIERGDCMFVDKARNIEKHGAIGGIVLDNAAGSSIDQLSLFAMSGDGNDDVNIPLVFLFQKEGHELLEIHNKIPDLRVELTNHDVPADQDFSRKDAESKQTESEVAKESQENRRPDLPKPSESSSIPSSSLPETEQIDAQGPLRSSTSEDVHNFYHHESLNIPARKYIMQAGTKFFHLTVEVTERQDKDTDEECRQMKYELFPDNSKVFQVFLRQKLRKDIEVEKPNLNEMYLDVIHAFQYNTNFDELHMSSSYMKAIARLMESAFFQMDRVDRDALEAIREMAKIIRMRHVFPNGETKIVSKNKDLDELPGTHPPEEPVLTHTFKVANDGLRTSLSSDTDEPSVRTPMKEEWSRGVREKVKKVEEVHSKLEQAQEFIRKKPSLSNEEYEQFLSDTDNIPLSSVSDTRSDISHSDSEAHQRNSHPTVPNKKEINPSQEAIDRIEKTSNSHSNVKEPIDEVHNENTVQDVTSKTKDEF